MAKHSQISSSFFDESHGSSHSQELVKFDSLPGISVKETVENLEGDFNLYLILLEEYAEEKSNICSHIRKALEDGQAEEACLLVHGMKGVASNLGLEELSQVSCRLEETLLQGGDEVSYLLECFESAQVVALSSIERLKKFLK